MIANVTRASGVLLIVLAASAWGTLGVFAVSLYQAGLSPVDVAAARITVAWIGFAVLVTVMHKGENIRLKLTDAGKLVLHGLIAVALYNLLYFMAIEKVGIALSVVLLYSAPVWSMLLGFIFLGESHPARTYCAVPVAVIGVAVAVMNPRELNLAVPMGGLLLGLGAALAYSLFSILGKPLLRFCSPSTLLFYSFGSGGLILLLVAGIDGGSGRLMSITFTTWLLLLATGIFPTFFAYLVYTEGLRRTPASLATLLATTEPVVAITLGVIIAGEHLSLQQLAGIILVLTATFIVTANCSTK